MNDMKGNLIAQSKVKEASISMRVVRKDGTIEDLGVVSHYSRNPAKRLLMAIWIWAKRAVLDRWFAFQRWRRDRRHSSNANATEGEDRQ